jgi:hypothetical protein
MKITATQRPFVLTFHATGMHYALTSDEAQRLLDEYPAVSAAENRVVLPGHNTRDPRQRSTLRPATAGGGPAFIIDRGRSILECKQCGRRVSFMFGVWPRCCGNALMTREGE